MGISGSPRELQLRRRRARGAHNQQKKKKTESERARQTRGRGEEKKWNMTLRFMQPGAVSGRPARHFSHNKTRKQRNRKWKRRKKLYDLAPGSDISPKTKSGIWFPALWRQKRLGINEIEYLTLFSYYYYCSFSFTFWITWDSIGGTTAGDKKKEKNT